MGADCVCCNQSLVTIVSRGRRCIGWRVTLSPHLDTGQRLNLRMSPNNSPESGAVDQSEAGPASHLIIALEWQLCIMSHSGHRTVIDHNQTIIRQPTIMGRGGPALALRPDKANWCHNFGTERQDESYIFENILRLFQNTLHHSLSILQYSPVARSSSLTRLSSPNRVHTSPNCVNWGEDKSRTLFCPRAYREKNGDIADIGKLCALDVWTIVPMSQVSANEVRLTRIWNFAPHNKQMNSKPLLQFQRHSYSSHHIYLSTYYVAE